MFAGPAVSAASLPRVTGLDPSTGPSDGGDVVIVYGDFIPEDVSRVQFGGLDAMDFRVRNDRLYALSPAHEPGEVNVTVTTPEGTSRASEDAASFTYVEPVGGAWTAAASLAQPRRGHTATVLKSGRVLVAGGSRPQSFERLASVELYDPVKDAWSSCGEGGAGPDCPGPMNDPRSQHTATLLPDGRVLVVGGNDADLTTAETYDPKTGTWTPRGSLNIRRFGFSATLLAGSPGECGVHCGKVLVAGGHGEEIPEPAPVPLVTPNSVAPSLYTAELYDPATGDWTLTGPLNTGRLDHTASSLPDGRVMVAGGVGLGDRLNCDLQLRCENLLIRNKVLADTEVYDPVTGTWAETDALNIQRRAHTARGLEDGTVLVAGGDSNAPGPSNQGTAELYDSLIPDLVSPGMTGAWSPVFRLNVARARHGAAVLPNGKVLVVGGAGPREEVPLASAELYDPTTRRWSITSSMLGPRIDVGEVVVLPEGPTSVCGSHCGKALVIGERAYKPGRLECCDGASVELYAPG